jgi:tRNA/rRNA methyltransferase
MKPDPQTSPKNHQNDVKGFFSRCRFVLVQTSHPGNAGSAARALKTMGFGRLVLVDPREPGVCAHPDALALASGADDVLARAEVVPDIDAALASATLTVALSARPREFGPSRVGPREAVEAARRQLLTNRQAEIAFVFGNERAGLPNDIVERCTLITHIPANPEYASLNLSQAVQLMAYEARMAFLDDVPDGAADGVGFQGEPASAEQIEGMLGHLEQALAEIGFLDPAQPKKLMPRLRRLFARTTLETEEVNILRGIAKHILKYRKGPQP